MIDRNMGLIRKTLATSEPVKLPDINQTVTVYSYYFTNGSMTKISEIFRADNNSAFYSDDTLTIDLNFGWNNVQMDYDIYWRILFVPCTGVFMTQFHDLKIHLSMDVNFKNYVIALKTFEFYELSSISTSINCSTICIPSSKLVIAYTETMKDDILAIMQVEVTREIEKVVENVNILLGNEPSKKFRFV
ncbi:uncharacterized protein LOC111643702 [Copidosoma floridanum]|uniref:uncharacterized protein LOC111643702 n=1 Tax=Copidosoma floridanum TaxID=29053 RepID=UPI000C6F6C27|nr:uncharacterized protein LOC111643702 [Copidosoma floridanum]